MQFYKLYLRHIIFCYIKILFCMCLSIVAKYVVCVCVCMYVYRCVCVCVCVCISLYTQIFKRMPHTLSLFPSFSLYLYLLFFSPALCTSNTAVKMNNNTRWRIPRVIDYVTSISVQSVISYERNSTDIAIQISTTQSFF